MYALTDASGAAADDAKSSAGLGRAQRDSARPTRRRQRPRQAFRVCDLLTSCGGPIASPRCSLTAVASPPCSFPLYDAALPLLSCDMRKTIFVSNNTDKTNIVSDNCHKLRFYFLHVRHT